MSEYLYLQRIRSPTTEVSGGDICFTVNAVNMIYIHLCQITPMLSIAAHFIISVVGDSIMEITTAGTSTLEIIYQLFSSY